MLDFTKTLNPKNPSSNWTIADRNAPESMKTLNPKNPSSN